MVNYFMSYNNNKILNICQEKYSQLKLLYSSKQLYDRTFMIKLFILFVDVENSNTHKPNTISLYQFNP